MLLNEIDKCYIGGIFQDKIFLGNTLIWPTDTPPQPRYVKYIYTETQEANSAIALPYIWNKNTVIDINWKYRFNAAGYYFGDINRRVFITGGRLYYDIEHYTSSTTRYRKSTSSAPYQTGDLSWKVGNWYIKDKKTGSNILSGSTQASLTDVNMNVRIGNMYIGSFKITEGDTVLYDLRACLDENGTPCMFDEISQRYFYSAGDVSNLRYIEYEPEPVENNKIYYTSTDGNIVNRYNTTGWGVNMISNTYVDGQGVIEFDDVVTKIPSHAFATKQTLKTIRIPSSVTSIEKDAFHTCAGLTNISIPSSVTRISEYALRSCSRLTSIILPSNISTLGNYVFYYCTSLKNLTIPSTIKSIGASAFAFCNALTKVTVQAATPPSLGTTAFANVVCPIYVPAGSVDAYKQAEGWSDYADRIQAIP